MNRKKNNDKRSYILTKETFGMTLLLFCALLTVILLTGGLVFFGFGKAICTFMYGTFGYASYIVVALLGYLGEWLVFEKKVKFNIRCSLCVALTVLMAFLLFHSVTTAKFDMGSYGNYLEQCYLNAANGYKGYTFGGVFCGLIVYPIANGTTYIGAYVIFALLTVLCAGLSFWVIRNYILGKAVAKAGAEAKAEKDESVAQPSDVSNKNIDSLYSLNENHEIVSRARASGAPQSARTEYEAPEQPHSSKQENKKHDINDKYSPENLGRKILFEPGEFAAESYRRNMIYNENSYFNHPVKNDDDYLKSFSSGSGQSATSFQPAPSAEISYTQDYSSGVENSDGDNQTPSYLYGDRPVESFGGSFEERSSSANEEFNSYTVDESSSSGFDNKFAEPQQTEQWTRPAPAEPVQPVQPAPPAPPAQSFEVPSREEVSSAPAEEEKPRERTNIFDIFSASNPRLSSQRNVEPDSSVIESSTRERSRENIFDDGDDGDNLFADSAPLGGQRVEPVRESRVPQETPRSMPPAVSQPKVEEAPKEEPPKPKHVWKKYVRPSLELLDDYPENNNVNTAEIEDSKRIICETLAGFRIDSKISNVVVGPAITRYDVIIEDRTNIKNALKYREAIAMALMKENVTAYLNYSKGAISIEVPNSSRCVVGLKGMLASSTFLNAKPNSLSFALGKNVEGQVVCPDITKMPHLLVAGTTGSGKSICLSTLIISLLYKYGPEELRFILVDPKQVEFISYDKLPHLMINEIIYDVDKAIKALNWAIKEMERRYQLFKEMTEQGVATKNLTEYNAHLPEGEEKLPKIVVILDEFGDLMLQAKKEIESRIIRLVQKSRACGIHLILATQRPSVDCITGLIKSNLPTRIGFKVNSFDDARCIFDIGGAEKLLGKGDLYFRSAENPELARIQGCFIDTHEVQKVTDFIKQNNETYFDQSVSDFINTVEEEARDDMGGGDGEDGGDASKVDDTFIKALKFCVTSNQASVSMIQRRFPIGYMKACKIIDWMENMNYITQSEGSKPRKVLLSREEFIQRYGDVDD